MIKKTLYDYQPPRSGWRPPVKPATRRFFPAALILVALTVGGLVLFGPSGPELEARTSPVEISAPAEVPHIRIPVQNKIEAVITSGETISSLLGGFLSPQEIHDLSQQSKQIFPLTRICAGQPYQICTLDDKFKSFTYEINQDEQLVIQRDGENLQVERVPITYEVRTEMVHGLVESSLFEAVSMAGETSELATSLADIFAWDIDFIRDLRNGDTFTALVEKRYREGKQAGYGQVLAAEFRNNGELYRAIYYKDADRPGSYYDETGRSVRKAFLKAPLAFSRISSGFSLKRFHPITKTWKAHPAIDYAAPTGTPIKTVGDGVIDRIGYTSGNGNFIEVRHNGTYKTLYLHMSKFAGGMKMGKRVAQGQVIGYVGATGLATGPHLCFRMFRNGSAVNPYKVKAPAAMPISTASLHDFKQKARDLIARLEGRDTLQVAALKAAAVDNQSSDK
ncbi:peptidoglycan DD-metalloendopeptidase family protein [Geopsychrobacter electrodiphilus]|uniref:peptidoglycan DD-metalloendopeptidase family protein n=1 Tax=Geopsychrobacter electrodiphilus TaxID=225196 RepID=UPI00036C717E|nr:peptidoglycan DD-metalloendopeptidase family protein [Geopsychrobacter electrodiphilus]